MPDPTDYGSWQTPPYLPQQAANAPFGLAGGYGYGFDPQLARNMARQQAFDTLTNAGLGLIQASQPSPYPQNFGTMFGGLAGGAALGNQQSRENTLKNYMQYAQLQNLQFQQQAMQQWLKGAPGQAAPQQAQPTPTQAPDGTTPPPTSVPTDNPQKLQQAMTYFQGLGLTKEQAAGLVGNMFEESRFNPSAVNPRDGSDGSDSIGAFQWNGPRYKALVQFAKDNNLDPADFQTQLQFAGHEFQTTHKAQFDALKGANTVQEATNAGLSYLTPGIDDKTRAAYLPNRLQFAQNAYGGGNGTPQGSGASSYPQPNPQVLARAQWEMTSPSPLIQKIGKDRQDAELKRVEQQQKQYEANIKLKQIAAENANRDVNPDGTPNAAKLRTEAEKKRMETEATETARTNALFGGKDWTQRSPEELRKTVNPELLSVAESVQAGRTPLGQVNQSRTASGISFSKNEVTALGEKLYGENWDPQGGDRREKFEEDLTKTTPNSTGGLVQSWITAIPHMRTWLDLQRSLQNGDSATVNSIVNEVRKQFGNANVPSAEAAGHLLAVEIDKAVSGDSTVSGREETKGIVNMNLNDPQATKLLQTLASMGGARFTGIQDRARYFKVPQGRIDAIVPKRVSDDLQYIMSSQAPATPAAQQQPQTPTAQAIPPAPQREVGKVYTTPKGAYLWTGQGWRAP